MLATKPSLILTVTYNCVTNNLLRNGSGADIVLQTTLTNQRYSIPYNVMVSNNR